MGIFKAFMFSFPARASFPWFTFANIQTRCSFTTLFFLITSALESYMIIVAANIAFLLDTVQKMGITAISKLHLVGRGSLTILLLASSLKKV